MGSIATPKSDYDAIVNVLAALGSSVRLALMTRLINCSFSVGELASVIGASNANVSHHLGILKDAGLVKSTKNGKKVIYSSEGPGVNQIVELTIRLHCGIRGNGKPISF